MRSLVANHAGIFFAERRGVALYRKVKRLTELNEFWVRHLKFFRKSMNSDIRTRLLRFRTTRLRRCLLRLLVTCETLTLCLTPHHVGIRFVQ